MFFVLRLLAYQLQNQADFLFQLMGEKERLIAETHGTQHETTLRQGNAHEQELSRMVTGEPPTNWLEQKSMDKPPVHWLTRVRQAAPVLLSNQEHTSHNRALPASLAEMGTRKTQGRQDIAVPPKPVSPSPEQLDGMLWSSLETRTTGNTETEIWQSDSEERDIQPGEMNHEDITRAEGAITSSSLDQTRSSQRKGRMFFVKNAKKMRMLFPFQRLSDKGNPILSTRLSDRKGQNEEEEATPILPSLATPLRRDQNAVLLPRNEESGIKSVQAGNEGTFPLPIEPAARSVPPTEEKVSVVEGIAPIALFVGPNRPDAERLLTPQPEQQSQPIREDQISDKTTQPIFLPSAIQAVQGTQIRERLRSAQVSSGTEVWRGENQPATPAVYVHTWQEQWPHLPTEPGFSADEVGYNSGTPQAMHHLFTKSGRHRPTPFDTQQLPHGTSGSRIETNWPCLSEENASGGQNWRAAYQAWAHQQRLDHEQRGMIWNV